MVINGHSQPGNIADTMILKWPSSFDAFYGSLAFFADVTQPLVKYLLIFIHFGLSFAMPTDDHR